VYGDNTMAAGTSHSFLNRTLNRVRRAWSEISTSRKGTDELKVHEDLPDEDLEKLKSVIQLSLDAPGGEVAARNTAATIGHAYLSLSTTGRKKFLKMLARDFDVDKPKIARAIDEYQNAKAVDNLPRLRRILQKALEAPRVRLLTLFNALPDGIKFLVDMRAELLSYQKENDAEFREVEKDLKHLLASWFDVGFLELRKITWDCPASLLEKLIEYEAVHEVASWDDLKNRLGDDRRMFAFFHPNMPSEPLIFINVAIVNGLADNVQSLLDTDAPVTDSSNADTAIFYSISNAQRGLSGISFGNFLIKRVVGEIRKELPHLKQFSTLSPIPGFTAWLDARILEGEEKLLTAEEAAILKDVAMKESALPGLKTLLSLPDWYERDTVSAALKPVLLRLCATYLTEQHPNRSRLLDPVAHFHVSNGAVIERLNWKGDSSAKGIARAAGIMVNYLYPVDSIDENSQRYAASNEANLSKDVQALLAEEQQSEE
jgi:malonyl-CoA decarboxylase